MEGNSNVRYKSLGVLITASFLTLGACASDSSTPAPPPVDASPLVEEVPTELPGVVPGESIPAEEPVDEPVDEPLPTEAAG